MRSSPVVGEAWCLGEPREAYVRSSGRKLVSSVGLLSTAFRCVVVGFRLGLGLYRGPSLGEKSVLRSRMTTLCKRHPQKPLIFEGFGLTVTTFDAPSDNLRVDGIGSRKGV
jgi:hypothetical protein